VLLELPDEVMGLVHPKHARLGVGDIDLSDRAWVLSKTPIGRKWLIKHLEQKNAIHAIVANHDNDLLWMPIEDEP